MKDQVEETVTIDGVELTRLQVETAMHKLNNLPKRPEPGRYISKLYGEVILVDGWLESEFKKAGHSLQGRLFCINERGNLLRLEPSDLMTP